MKKILLLAMCMSMLQGCSNNAEKLLPSKEYYVDVVGELSSAQYYGRSNYENGSVKAAEFILGEIGKLGVKTVPEEVIVKAWEGKQKPELHALQPEFKSMITPSDPRRWSNGTPEQLSYMQHFTHPLNAQRGAVELVVDGDTLNHTVQYTLKEFSPTFKGELDVVYLDNKYLLPDEFCKYVNSGAFKDKAVVLDWDRFCETMYTFPGIEVYKTYFVPMENVGALICKGKELLPYFKSRNHFNTPMPVFMVDETFPADAKKVSIDVEAQMIENDAHNIIAWIPGTKYTEKHYIISCHYDHLGICGDEIFYGANDNASGTAMLLNLMRHYKENPPEYSVMFIFFDAEENNLLGSFFYADNPLLPLEDIQYFVELDMIGDNGNTIYCQISDSGEEGLECLNAISSSLPVPFAKLDRHPLDDYADHYPFALKGVPAIYIEMDGDTNKNYHSPRDTFENFSADNYERLFTLITEFVKGYRK
ncbi:MAG: M28 family peptidase [Bacteroidales bacterium]|nr:M28 family peptidase [Bacteroidales bacterium]